MHFEWVCGQGSEMDSMVESMQTESCKIMTMSMEANRGRVRQYCPAHTLKDRIAAPYATPTDVPTDHCTAYGWMHIKPAPERSSYGGTERTCDNFCKAFKGLKCLAAAVDKANDCMPDTNIPLSCSESYQNRADLICTCGIDDAVNTLAKVSLPSNSCSLPLHACLCRNQPHSKSSAPGLPSWAPHPDTFHMTAEPTYNSLSVCILHSTTPPPLTILLSTRPRRTLLSTKHARIWPFSATTPKPDRFVRPTLMAPAPLWRCFKNCPSAPATRTAPPSRAWNARPPTLTDTPHATLTSVTERKEC